MSLLLTILRCTVVTATNKNRPEKEDLSSNPLFLPRNTLGRGSAGNSKLAAD